MKIVRQDSIYVSRGRGVKERSLLKNAGFKLNHKDGLWYSGSDDAAMELYDYTVKSARKRLDGIRFVHEQLAKEAVADSYATDTAEEFPSPENLRYLEFQKAGIKYAIQRYFTLIADQPGLGKTIQAIGIANAIPTIKKILIVVPASLKINWKREFLRWDVKGLSVGVAESYPERIPNSKPARYRASHEWPDTDVVIISYKMTEEYTEEIHAKEWDYVVCDESHMLNNLKTMRTKQLLGGGSGKNKINPINAKKWVWLSGTPILNKPIELWTILSTFDSSGLGRNWVSFVRKYCDGHKDFFEKWITSGASNGEELGIHIRTKFMIRRLKKDVLKDLPDKIRHPVFLPQEGMKRVVKKEYETFCDNLARLDALNEDREYTKDELKDLPEEEIRELVSGVLDKGKLPEWNEGVASRTEGDKIHFEAMSTVREDVALAKIPMACAYVDTLLEAGEKVIIFVVHKSVAKAFKEHYDKKNSVDAVLVVGGMTDKAKQASVDRFQEDPYCNVFIGNIDAAGVGYTLTESSHVVMAELSWTPSKGEQAEDRAHRIGQDNAVTVHYLLIDGSIECLMLDALLAKQDAIEKILN